MPRPEKVQAVAEIKDKFESAQAVFLAEYAGLSVKEQQEMRRALRAADSQFKVVKMTLAKLAAEELGHTGLAEILSGPTGLTFANADAAATAKVLQDFANDHASLIIKGALLSGGFLPPEKVSELAALPTRDVLLAQVAGALQAPMAAMANLMAVMPRDLATMMKELIDKLPDEAPAEEPEPVEEAATEAPAEEAAAEETAADAEADEAAAEEAPEAAPEDAAEEEVPEPAEEPEEAPAEEAAADEPEATEEAEEAPAAETNDENDEADEAEEEKTNG
jgi:large subunit ribosomal protein L10